MKYKITLLIALFFSISSMFAQKNIVKLVSSSNTETILTFKIESHNLKDVKTPNGIEKILIAENTTAILQKGFPDLPKFTESIIIPDFGKTKIEIISSNFYEVENVNIAPSKGNLTRDIDPKTIPYEYGKTYKTDEFFPKQIASTDNPYIARDYRGQAVHVYPFTYNAVKKTLRVYTEITIKITSTKDKGVNEFKRNNSFTKVAKEFKNIYSNHFINYSSQTKYTPVEEEGNMLVICYDDWTSEMQALVDWKNKIGRPCEMVTVTEAGGTYSAIATYVENYYNNNGLTYLLLVGDNAQCPTIPGPESAGSDNSYAYITGNDHYLEFFVGRFSAETPAHVSTQVQRTITYENGSTLEDGWLKRTVGIASNDPGTAPDDGEWDWEHYRNMATDLLAFTYIESLEFFDDSQGGGDASGDPTSTMVGTEINNGVGIINYTGHGGETTWVTSGFSNSDINNLTNDNKLPFIFDVACVNGAFLEPSPCFGEAWLRAENGAEPTGAIAICASTINQSWAPPMDAQDEMVDLVVGVSVHGTKRTFTGIAVNGMFQMNDDYSDWNMTDTWTTFGDPSVLIRTDNTSNMVISHNSTIIFGETNFSINSDLDGAFACLSVEGVILGTATVTGGVADVSFSGTNPGDVVTIAVTGFNKVTYLTTVTVIAPNGPYITVDGFTINSGNSINYAQTENINLTLKNVGPDEATGVTATLTTTDEYVTSLTNNTDVSFGDITGDNGTVTSTASFTLTVANNVPDGHIIAFDVEINSTNKTTWNGNINVIANAPVLEVALDAINDNSDQLSFVSNPIVDISENESYSYDIIVEGNAGNGNGFLDPGETVAIAINTGNVGHADLIAAECTLSSTSPYVTVNSGIMNLGLVEVGATIPAIFNITIDESTPIGSSVELIITFLGGEYSETLTLNLPVGLQIEDFESEDFSSYPWNMGGSADWMMDTDAYEGSNSAKSGLISDNQTSELSMTCNVTADGEISFWSKVSSENNYDFLRFYIDGTEQGEWSATETWAEQTFDVSAGSHTFKWAYEKDGSVSSGDDCAWVDYIIFPGHSSAKSSKGISITAPTLPTWLTLADNGDGTANLSGTAPSVSGTHNVILQAQDIGEPTTQEFTIGIGVFSVSSLAKDISIYPNPTNGTFNLNLSSLNGEKANVEITSVSGQIVYLTETTSDMLRIDLNNQAKGVYFVKITSGRGIVNYKLILE